MNKKLDRDLALDPMGINVGSDFRCGATNSDLSIQKLTHINGVPINILQERMRPNHTQGKGFGMYSYLGFLGSNEDLLREMVNANRLVRELGYTHQDMAKTLQHFINQYNSGKNLIDYGNMQIEVDYVLGVTEGQQSPFKNGSADDPESGIWKGTVRLLNYTTGRVMSFPPQLPRWIHNYGFYEGRQSPYYCGPEVIVDFLTNRERIYKTFEEIENSRRKTCKQNGLRLVGISRKSGVSTNKLDPLKGDYLVKSVAGDFLVETQEYLSIFDCHATDCKITLADGRSLKINAIGDYRIERTKNGLTLKAKSKNRKISAELYDKPNMYGWDIKCLSDEALNVDNFGDILRQNQFPIYYQTGDSLAFYASPNNSFYVLKRPDVGITCLYHLGEKKQQILLTTAKSIQLFLGLSEEADAYIEDIVDVRRTRDKIMGKAIYKGKKYEFSIA